MTHINFGFLCSYFCFLFNFIPYFALYFHFVFSKYHFDINFLKFLSASTNRVAPCKESYRNYYIIQKYAYYWKNVVDTKIYLLFSFLQLFVRNCGKCDYIMKFQTPTIGIKWYLSSHRA